MSTIYGDISPRTAMFAAAELLKRGQPFLVLEKFGQTKPLPERSSKTIVFRRYNPLPKDIKVLTEGMTPSANTLTKTDVTCTLTQMGDRIQISDIIIDHHEDAVLNEATMILGEQAAQMIELSRFNVLKAGTSVFYPNGSTRAGVTGKISTALQRKCTRFLKRNNARQITTVVRSTPNFGTENVAPSFIGLVHPDLESDIRDMTGFTPVEKYGTVSPYESEIGKVEDVRYVASTVFESWANAGGAAGSTLLSTGGANADVYPVLYVARDAYGIIPFKGKTAVTPMVVNPSPSDSDPMAQRGHVSWKAMQGCVILQDLWMTRLEVAVAA